ncbi:MAG: 5'-nucleotidase, lipoprotein e(P4) family [Marinilabiliales bacterium]|nr:MAG: 5'-nucleotidase, lipoprotein e(P4) family [Marinilabiliales bacterium]
MKKFFPILLLAVGLLSFQVVSDFKGVDKKIKKPSDSPMHYMQLAISWYQTAAETRALCYQAFNAARMSLDLTLQTAATDKPLAIVFDIDETLLDNSPYQAACVHTGIAYPDYWKEWIQSVQCEPVPGAVEFVQYADSRGVDVFYVSNRKMHNLDATIENMNKYEFPQVEKSHIMLRETTSNKTPRREKIAETHNIIMLVGDNLGDFNEEASKKSIEERFAVADKYQNQYGRTYIVLPNPMYGDWEGAMYNFDYSLSPEEKDELRNKVMNVYMCVK